MSYPILPAGAFIGAFFTLIIAFWNWRARHVPILSLIVWLFARNVSYGANSLIWSDDAKNKAPIWCDIFAKFTVGASVALPACVLCISKHLAMIGGGRTARLDHRDRKRIVVIDIGFCWGAPVLVMALHYIVQGHRYDIIQYIGCFATTYISIPGIIIVYLPPLLLSIGGSVYAGIALYHFVHTRRALSSVLQVAGSSMSANQYKRLMAMSVALMVWSTMLTTFVVLANVLRGVRPWVSWEDVHYDWYRVQAVPWVLLDPFSRTTVLIGYWATPVSTLIAFVFLGFGEDAMKGYRKVGNAIVSVFQSKVLLKRNEKPGKGTVPVPPLPSSGFRPPTPSPPNTPEVPTLQELPQIQPVRSLYSMIGPPRLKTQSQSSGKSYGWRWSATSEKLQPPSLDLDGAELGISGRASGSGTVTIAEPNEILTGGSVQEEILGGEPHDQV